MSDDKKITRSTPRYDVSEPEKGAVQGKKTHKAAQTSTITTSTSSETPPKVDNKGQVTLPRAKEDADPEVTAECLTKLANDLNCTITLSPDKAQALINLYKEAGGKPLDEKQLATLQEMLGSFTPKELKKLVDDALLKYAIGPDGKFTPKFVECLKNPNLKAPTGSKEDIKEAFSLFALLLLINKLTSAQREMAARGAQTEQERIKTTYDLKITNIKTKAYKEAIVSILTTAVSTVVGFGSAIAGGQSTTRGMGLSKTSDFISSIGQNFEKVFVTTEHDVIGQRLEKEQASLQFDKDSYSKEVDNTNQRASELLRNADSLIQDTQTSTKMAIRNI